MEIKDRILVIEDDKSIRNFLRAVLEANSYDVIMANTGIEAYGLITSQCPDLVILDLGLPDMDGMKILKSVREWSSVPVVVVSARSHEKDKVMIILPSRLEHRSCLPGSVPRSVIRGPLRQHPDLDRAEPSNPAAL